MGACARKLLLERRFPLCLLLLQLARLDRIGARCGRTRRREGTRVRLKARLEIEGWRNGRKLVVPATPVEERSEDDEGESYDARTDTTDDCTRIAHSTLRLRRGDGDGEQG